MARSIRPQDGWATVDSETDCWNWKFSCVSSGYGAKKYRGKMWRAHRLQWTLTYGAIPEGLNVLHRCDNKVCINPDHLFLGTQFDNIHDMIAKGRQDFMGMLASRRTGVRNGT